MKFQSLKSMTTHSPAGFRCVNTRMRYTVQLMDRAGGKRMCYNVAPLSSWYNVHINSATTIKTCNCHTAFLAFGFSGYFTTHCSRVSSMARKKKANDNMAPSTYFFHNFEQQDRFSQNSTDIM
jgi:hypothetical protein